MALAAIELDAGYAGTAVVRGVSFTVEPGLVTAMVGPNGAGKSTLVRALVGTLATMAGRVELDGVPLSRVPVRERARRVALVPQVSGEGRSFSVIQAVRMGRLARREPRATTDAVSRHALARLGLAARAEEPLGILSVGQQQRVLVARALAQLGLVDAGEAGTDETLGAAGHAPETAPLASGTGVERTPRAYLLADEPIASMDPEHALRTMGVLREAARRGVGVLVVLHDFALAARFADRAVLMDGNGRAAASGSSADVLTESNLQRVFGARFRMVADERNEMRFAVAVETDQL